MKEWKYGGKIVSEENTPRGDSQPPFRLLLSPKPPHVVFGARIYGNSDYKHYLKVKEEVELERGIRCAEVIITREGEFKLTQPVMEGFGDGRV